MLMVIVNKLWLMENSLSGTKSRDILSMNYEVNSVENTVECDAETSKLKTYLIGHSFDILVNQ